MTATIPTVTTDYDLAPCIAAGEHRPAMRHPRAACPVLDVVPDTRDTCLHCGTTISEDNGVWTDAMNDDQCRDDAGHSHEPADAAQERKDVRGCSCGMADYGAPGHDGHDDADALAVQSVTVRHLLVELPFNERFFAEAHVDSIAGDVRELLDDEPTFVGRAHVTEVHPGDVVSGEDTADHDTMRTLLRSLEATGEGDGNEDLLAAYRAALTVALTRWPGVTDDLA